MLILIDLSGITYNLIAGTKDLHILWLLLYINPVVGALQFIPALILFARSDNYKSVPLGLYLGLSVILIALTIMNFNSESFNVFIFLMSLCYVLAHFHSLIINSFYAQKMKTKS